ncbi:glycosyl transferase family 2 [Pseudoalteromonas sp. SW0106-04]|uniref:hypothetical protein n=1 Tax=Pseudoalteromonas sp. SW0106-04 TaxID=1702169 RepID=UPI0006B5DAD8|nr:hypothetical protein [Pseudoalteromonas sp. SW0106-04]GAP74589.1 glycosyl transferase family 2 [Pseudoalteromonas sp. SW0106-04]
MIKSKLKKLYYKSKISALHLKILSVHFDKAFYLENNIDVTLSGFDPVEHYLLFGELENRKPNRGFSPEIYRAAMIEGRKVESLFIDYLERGQYQGSCLLDMPEFYSLSDNEKTELMHQYNTLKPYFDKDYYCSKYNVDECEKDPLMDYLISGWKFGKNPSRQFSTDYYLESNEDVKLSGINPLYHYVNSGYKEGRAIANESVESNKGSFATSEPIEDSYIKEVIEPYFDVNYYLKMYPEVLSNKCSPLVHYVEKGWKELKNPNADFSTKFYLEDNPDVAEANINPYFHYLVSGKNERRFPKRPGGEKAENIYKLGSLQSIVEQWKCLGSPKSLITEAVIKEKLGELKNKVYLSFSHDVYTKNIGGVQICVALEERAVLDKGASYLHIAPYQPLPTLASTQEKQFLVHISLNGTYLGVADLKTVESALPKDKHYTAILHALHGHSPELLKDLFALINLRKCYLWIHDYFTICEGYNLLRNTVSYCGAPKVDSKACGICIYGKTRESHIQRIDSLLEGLCVEAIAPSQVAKDVWLSATNGRTSLESVNVNVIEHIQFHKETLRSSASDRKLKIAFLGYPSFHKGGEEFAKLAEKLVTNDSVELYHIGQNPTENSTINFVECEVSKEKPHAMIEAIRAQDIDYVFIPALWPETFNITCYEAIAAGCKVITYPSSGNVSNYIISNDLGVEVENVDELLSMIKDAKLLPINQKIDREVKYSKMTMECEK